MLQNKAKTLREHVWYARKKKQKQKLKADKLRSQQMMKITVHHFDRTIFKITKWWYDGTISRGHQQYYK